MDILYKNKKTLISIKLGATMEAVDLRALEEAVIVFYRSGSSQQAAAHEWLTEVQTSKQAWSFTWDLMRLDKVVSRIFFL